MSFSIYIFLSRVKCYGIPICRLTAEQISSPDSTAVAFIDTGFGLAFVNTRRMSGSWLRSAVFRHFGRRQALRYQYQAYISGRLRAKAYAPITANTGLLFQPTLDCCSSRHWAAITADTRLLLQPILGCGHPPKPRRFLVADGRLRDVFSHGRIP
jgi:hypothetical protein